MLENIIRNGTLEISSAAPDTEKINFLTDELLCELKNKKIIIYPAGYMGQLVEKTLAEYGINIEFYIDRSAEIINKIKKTPVYGVQRLSGLSENTVVLVSANLDTMARQLSNIAKEHNRQITILNGFETNRLLRFGICSGKLFNDDSFDLIECENCGFERHGCSLCMTYLRRTASSTTVDNDWRSKSFTWFGYIVGQACTLKCIHCCEAIPYLKEHKFVPKDTIVEDIRKVAASSRFLSFVELVGGEPFMHPDFKDLLEELLEIKNIGYIKSFTNATIVPDIELCRTLKNPRFMLQISNYEKQATGKLLENIVLTKKILKEQSVPYIYTQNFEWQDFSSFDLHNTDEDKLKTIFNACTLRNCNRLYNSILYRCPHQYAGMELGRLKKYPIECVDINRHNERSLAEALEAFENVSYIDACRYCLMPFDAPPVPAGIQLHKV